MQQITVRTMHPDDYPALLRLWLATEGMHLNESDEEEPFVRCLERNDGLSAVAVGAGGEVLGSVLCTFDGRSGYLHHLAVTPALRGEGVARSLIEFSLERLAGNGVMRCNIFILADNVAGQAFWQHNGWSERPWRIMQHPLPRTDGGSTQRTSAD